ncbi:MAG: hypothetical protein ACI4KA_07960 [Oscillospiraceae bacterium]
MITDVLCVGAAAVLVTVLIRGLSDTLRGMVCWTFAFIAAVVSLVIYCCNYAGMTTDLKAVIRGLCGAAVIVSVSLVIELFSPTKRLRSRQRAEYDKERSEMAINVIMIILAAAAAVCSGIADRLGYSEYSVLGIIPCAGISLRQLTYFVYRAKLDTLRVDNTAALREKLLKRLSSHNRTL